MQESGQFADLRKTFRGFTFPVFIAALVWYFVYMVSAIYFPEVMGRPFLGMNVGIWFGLAQFVTTFAITWIYVVYANKNFEPRQAAIRAEMEG